MTCGTVSYPPAVARAGELPCTAYYIDANLAGISAECSMFKVVDVRFLGDGPG